MLYVEQGQIFTDEAWFPINGHVSHHICQIWRAEQPHEVSE
jgi:hypothetical protein